MHLGDLYQFEDARDFYQFLTPWRVWPESVVEYLTTKFDRPPALHINRCVFDARAENRRITEDLEDEWLWDCVEQDKLDRDGYCRECASIGSERDVLGVLIPCPHCKED